MTSAAPESLYRQAQQHAGRDPLGAQTLALYQQAARLGHADAAFQAGMILLEQQAGFDEAAAWLEMAAAHKHAPAAFNLLRVREAQGKPFGKHLQQYAMLAEGGMLPAALHLLEYYANHHDPQAVYWARFVAEQGHPFGQYFLALHYHLGSEPDFDQARRYYHLAAEQGLSVAHWQLGKIYLHGIGTPADTEKAVFHLTQAAEHGITAAQTMLGGLLAAQGRPDALRWYQTAAEQGDGEAQAALAQHYLTGTLTERNPAQALRLARAAVEHHHPDALRLLGDINRYGLGIPADPQAAQSYYRQSTELGNSAAFQKLLADAALYHPQQFEQIKQAALLRQKIEQTYQTALSLHQGRGQTADYTRARKLYLEAAEYQHGGAAAQLGMMYYYGQGVPAAPKNAAYWFELAAEQGDSTAQYHLARMYYYGQGVPLNLPLACYWLEAAIAGGYEDPEAFKHLLAQWQKEMAQENTRRQTAESEHSEA
ncbi:tetratricopeptide repeat protein [Neisseria perflava]|uniref:tetratricopeptide repeat protein n=1 Tax=Neisseria perflava TaxID=33053 RepID=UPI00209F163C|nr:tetratricopeptide repeat protein [Neisseria perflava]MCP1661029.1 TPR repeat protein [Neisseria perflava]